MLQPLEQLSARAQLPLRIAPLKAHRVPRWSLVTSVVASMYGEGGSRWQAPATARRRQLPHRPPRAAPPCWFRLGPRRRCGRRHWGGRPPPCRAVGGRMAGLVRPAAMRAGPPPAPRSGRRRRRRCRSDARGAPRATLARGEHRPVRAHLPATPPGRPHTPISSCRKQVRRCREVPSDMGCGGGIGRATGRVLRRG